MNKYTGETVIIVVDFPDPRWYRYPYFSLAPYSSTRIKTLALLWPDVCHGKIYKPRWMVSAPSFGTVGSRMINHPLLSIKCECPYDWDDWCCSPLLILLFFIVGYGSRLCVSHHPEYPSYQIYNSAATIFLWLIGYPRCFTMGIQLQPPKRRMIRIFASCFCTLT